MVFSDSVISFIAGANYGFVSVLVGQPLGIYDITLTIRSTICKTHARDADTIKTRSQAFSKKQSTWTIGRDLFRSEGIRGMYRGGLPLFLGGSLFRSAQFGFYENAMHLMKTKGIKERNIPGTNVFAPNRAFYTRKST